MASPRIFLINFRDVVGFTNGGKTREFYFPEETAKALAEMLADPVNQVVIISEKDEEKLIRDAIFGLFKQTPKNVSFAGRDSVVAPSADPFILRIAEDHKRRLIAAAEASPVIAAASPAVSAAVAAASVASPASIPAINPEIIVIDRHPEIFPAARAKNFVPVLVPIHYGEKRPLSASYLFAAARVGSYANALKNELMRLMSLVVDRKTKEPMFALEANYKYIVELKKTTESKLKICQENILAFKQPKCQASEFAACEALLKGLEKLALDLNDNSILGALSDLKNELELQMTYKLVEMCEKSMREYVERQNPSDYRTATEYLRAASYHAERSGSPHLQLELFALEFARLRNHQQVLIKSATGGSCIVEQLAVLNSFNALYAKYKDTPNAISYKHLEAKLQTELNAIKQIILNYFLAKRLPGGSTGMPDGFDVNQMHLALRTIMDFERDTVVSYKSATAPEASVLIYLNLDTAIRKAVGEAASDVGPNTSYFVILAEQLMAAVNTLSPPSTKLLFSTPENINRLFSLLDIAYQECLKYQGALTPTALKEKNLTKIMHDIIQCKVHVLKESRVITHLYVIGKENVLTKADGKTLSFLETTIPVLRNLLSNPNAVVVFTSDSLGFVEYQHFMSDNGIVPFASVIYLPKSYLASVADPNCDYMKSNIAQQTVDITVAAETNLFVMPNPQSIDAPFINDEVKSGDYVLTKDQGNWVLAKKQGTDLAREAIEGNVAVVLETLKAFHPSRLEDIHKGQIKAALTANAAKGKVKKPLSDFPVLLVSECMRLQLGIRQPECLTIVHNDFRTIFAASQRSASAIWTGVVSGVAQEQPSPNALALVPVLSTLRSDVNTAKAYTAVTESFTAIDETNRHQPKHGAELTLQQKSLTALDEKYGQCLLGKTLAADSLKTGITELGKVKGLQPLANQRAYDEAYANVYNAAKKPLLDAINRAKLFNDKKTQFAALICHAELSATWHAHAARIGDQSYRIKMNDFISDLLTSINQPELTQLINETTDKAMLETFAKLLTACSGMLDQARTASKQSFFVDTKEVTAKAQIEREISLINLTLPKVEARLQELNPSFFSRLLSPTK